MERVSSAPRLSFTGQDIFNLRNHKLSRSAPGIDHQGAYLFDTGATPLKSILVKSRESIPERSDDEEEDDRKSITASIKVELQFTAFVFLCFVLIIVIPLSMIIMGSIHVNNCPVQGMIPIFLIIGGSAVLSSVIVSRRASVFAKERYGDDRILKAIAMIFHLAWFIAGCYWIYGSYEPDYFNDQSAHYCNKTLYMFAFWFLNSVFLTMAVFAFSFGVYIMFGREPTTSPEVHV